MIHIPPNETNGLDKESAADAFQVKSLSRNRFVHKIGVLDEPKLDEIAAAVALCIGFSPGDNS